MGFLIGMGGGTYPHTYTHIHIYTHRDKRKGGNGADLTRCCWAAQSPLGSMLTEEMDGEAWVIMLILCRGNGVGLLRFTAGRPRTGDYPE